MITSLEDLCKDIRYGFRGLRRSPGFALILVLTFALGVGINAAVFSVVRSVLLKPLPYPESERLVRFGESAGKVEGISVSWGNFLHWRGSNRSFESMAAYQFTERTLTGHGEPVVSLGLMVTYPYFGLLGVHPLLGRLPGAADDRPGAPAVVLLNYRFWQRQFGGDPHIAGTSITLNGNPFEVIGVMAPLYEPWKVDYYLPLGRSAGSTDRSRHGSIRMLGRLKQGVTLAAARADLDAIMRHLAEIDPGPENGHRSYGQFLAQNLTGDVRATLLVLMGAATLILLIACANIASLLLARNAARSGELAVRKAVGAGNWRLVRQLLTETMAIAAIGGAAGIALAFWTVRALVALAPKGIPRLAETAIDPVVLLFACGVAVAAGLAAGVGPVMLAGRIDLTSALKEGARTAGTGKRRQLSRSLLVIGEVALTFVLAFAAGLLLRSLIAAERSNPGFDARRMLAFSLQLPSKTYGSADAIGEFYGRLLADLRGVPGVTGASAVACPPGAGDCGDYFYSIADRPAPTRNEVPVSLFNSAVPGYFRMMGTPVRAGREFNESDRAGGREVAVINETLARQWWPAGGAVGHRIKFGGPYMDGPVLEIVGVVGDIRQSGLDAEPDPEIFLPFAQRRSGAMTILLRTAGEPSSMMAAVRQRVLALDRNLPLQHLETMEESLGAGLARRRFSTLLLALFAALAMTLAGIGIYGLLSYWVSSREAEIAIRLALGARPATILRWTGLQALRLAAIGVVLGMVGGWAAARTLETMVFGIPARNPATMIGAAAAVIALALLSAGVPAWRAARVDAAARLHGA